MSDATTTNADPATTAPEASAEKTFSLEYVQELRNEAAKHRTAKQTLADELTAKHDVALSAAKSEAEATIAAAQGETATERLTAAKLRAAIELNVPADKLDSFLDTVQGSNPDEVKESAAKLSDLTGGFGKPTSTPATDPSQGKGGAVPPLNGDPLLGSLKQKLGI